MSRLFRAPAKLRRELKTGRNPGQVECGPAAFLGRVGRFTSERGPIRREPHVLDITPPPRRLGISLRRGSLAGPNECTDYTRLLRFRPGRAVERTQRRHGGWVGCLSQIANILAPLGAEVSAAAVPTEEEEQEVTFEGDRSARNPGRGGLGVLEPPQRETS